LKKKVICFVLGDYYEQVRGGAEYQAYLLAKELKRRGYEIHYIYIDNGRKFVHELDIYLHPVKRNRFVKRVITSYSYLFDVPRIYSKIKRLNPDIIYQRTGTTHTGVAAYYARKHKKRLIWHVALDKDVIPKTANLRNIINGAFLSDLLLRYGIRNADKIVTQAAYQNALLEENYGRSCDAIVPNFHPVPPDFTDEKGQGKVLISWVANFKPDKRPMKYVELAKAFSDDPEIIFNMVGRISTPFGEAIRREVAKVRNIQYLGELTQDEVNILLNKTHIFVNTSSNEGFPNTFIQAWMRKVPVLSLDVDPDNVLETKAIGYCSRSMPQLISDCRALVRNDALREEMGNRGYNYAVERHSVAANIDQIMEILGC
jgi:glycosyltransferase involved in cell wall biosynthesis